MPPQAFDIWDKAQHTVAFAVLMALGWRAYPADRLHVLFGLLAFGATIEVQGASSRRRAFR